MKKLLVILALASCAWAQTTTTITGTLKDLTGAAVTSGKVVFTLTPSRDTTISGVARFTPTSVTCLINGSGLIQAQDGVSVCTLTMNTALSPPGSYYTVGVWPYNVKTSSFNFYAVNSTYDWSTVVPTPATSPAQNFVDTFSNQAIAGTKTFMSLNGPIGLATPNTGAFTSTNVTNAGIFTGTQMQQYLSSFVGGISPTLWHDVCPGCGFTTEAITGGVKIPSTASIHQASALTGYASTQAASASRTVNNAVGVFTLGVAGANNSAAWGANFVTEDVAGISGHNIVGTELDIGVQGTPLFVNGLDVILSPVNGVSGTMPATSIGLGIEASNPVNLAFATGIFIGRGAVSLGGIFMDGLCVSGSCPSANIEQVGYTAGVPFATTIQANQNGDMVLAAAGGRAVVIGGGGSNFSSLPAASNGSLIYCNDCKNVTDNAAVAGATCVGAGAGAIAKRQNNRWDCN